MLVKKIKIYGEKLLYAPLGRSRKAAATLGGNGF
jgi:hypothetical protein